MVNKISRRWIRSKIIFEKSSWTNSIIFSNIRPFFAAGNSDSSIGIWDTRSFRKISTLKGARSSINKLIMHEKSGNLISASEDMNILSWKFSY